MKLDEIPEYREVVERASADTDISDHLPVLFERALEVKPKMIVELGVRGGESTFVLERVARLSNATLVSVDIEDCSKASTWNRWHFVKGDDVEFAHQFAAWCVERGLEPEIDVLFLDTSHELEHTRLELRSWLPFLTPGGRAFFHDTNLRRVVRRKDGRKQVAWDNQRGVIRAIEEHLGHQLDERRAFTLELADWRVEHVPHTHGFTMLERRASGGAKPKIAVFCERIDNESFCESIVRELGTFYDVRAYGPGWSKERLTDLDREELRFHLELDPASGNFHRPPEPELIGAPRFAWLIDTHKKPDFHRMISREVDLTFYAMRNWGHVLEGRTAWLPLHCDQKIFYPRERDRDIDVVFVGSYGWRAEAILKLAEKHGLRAHVECTTGEREKTETAELYSRAKVVFNRHITNDLNFRVFEAMACGRVLLTDAQPNGQYELFKDGEHFLLYKDEQDLERLLLDVLGDRERRERIEREAARTARAAHTTRARVRELRRAIEHALGTTTLAPHQGAPVKSVEPRRWLVLRTSEYGDRLARALAERGHDVVVAGERRGALPARSSPTRAVLDRGIALPTSEMNNSLAASGPLHRSLASLLAREAAFDAVLAEGALAALVAAPAASRLDVPFFFAIERVEVERRRNRLSREQLYRAELEQWAIARARAVLVPDATAKEAAEQYYEAADVIRLAGGPRHVVPPRGAEKLAAMLGLADFILVLGADLSAVEKRSILASFEGSLVLASDDVQVGRAGTARILSRRPLEGVTLAALASAASRVVTLDVHDERVPQLVGLARELAHVSRETAIAGREWWKAARPLERSERADSPAAFEELESLLETEHAVL